MSEWDKFEAWWAKNGARAEKQADYPQDFPFIAFKMVAWSAWNARSSMNKDGT